MRGVPGVGELDQEAAVFAALVESCIDHGLDVQLGRVSNYVAHKDQFRRLHDDFCRSVFPDSPIGGGRSSST